jgi:hypothetical protein
MYITVKSLESDPDSSNLDCSTNAINIILRRVRNYLLVEQSQIVLLIH